MTDKEAFAAFRHKNPCGLSFEERQLVRAAAKEEAREQVEQEELVQEEQPKRSFSFGQALRGDGDDDEPEPSLGGALQDLSVQGDPEVCWR